MTSETSERSSFLGFVPNAWMPFLIRVFFTVSNWSSRVFTQVVRTWAAMKDSFEPRAVKFYSVATSSVDTYQPHTGPLNSSPLYPLGTCDWYYMMGERTFLSSRAMETAVTYPLDVIGGSLHYASTNALAYDLSEWVSDIQVTSERRDMFPPPQVLVGGFLLETNQHLWHQPSDYILRLTTMDGEQVWSLATNRQTIDIPELSSDSEEEGEVKE